MQTIEVRDGYYVQFDEFGGLMGVRIDNRVPNTMNVPVREAIIIHDESVTINRKKYTYHTNQTPLEVLAGDTDG